MNTKCLIALLLLAPPAFCQAAVNWVLDQGTLTYYVTHAVHHVEGTSHAARGKGVCQAGVCDFLVAAPVKSFDSGDSNRDLHMLQVTRGAQFPMVVVRTQFSEAATTAPTINADLEVQFAGQTVHYKGVPFQRTTQGDEVRITGTIPATCSDFKITPPSFLTMPIKNEISVRADLRWHRDR
ncbi:MAG TPA: hypothetical protein VKX25_11955 [Bryobacteraceae bacterium]|nr:hypothetical protein [Bryobacteraceae bacterium]